MLDKRPLRQVLIATREHWDCAGTRPSIRENFLKMIQCGTSALGAEVYASRTERKLVYHTCKSRFCPSCGHRATLLWQEEMDAALPDIPYVNVNFTMPCELWPILRQNRRIWHDLPAVAAAALQHWVNAKYGVRVLLLVVQQTFGGLLTFHPHLHILVSAGGLEKSTGQWTAELHFNKRELMRSWRYAVTAYLSRAREAGLIKSNMGSDEIKTLLREQYQRSWNVFVGRNMSKTRFLRYAGRYIRRPPIAEYRLKRIDAQAVEYLGKDTAANQSVRLRFSNTGFVDILKEHVPVRFRHAMRYFGLLSPRSKHLTSTGLFALLKQNRRPRPRRLSWADTLWKHFRTDPLIDNLGQRMDWTGRINPTTT